MFSHGENFELIETFLQSQLKYNKLEIKVHDPINNKETSYVVDLVELNQPDHAISKVSAYQKI